MALTLPPALRSIRRSPAFLASAVAVLSLGMTAAIVVFALARALLLHPVDYRDPETLVQLRERGPRGDVAPLTGAELRLARDRSDLAGVAAIDLGMFQLTGVAEPEEFAGAAITRDTWRPSASDPSSATTSPAAAPTKCSSATAPGPAASPATQPSSAK